MVKIKNNVVWVFVVSLLFIAMVVLQFYRVAQTAHLHEEIFKKTVEMALKNTADKLSKQPVFCEQMKSSICAQNKLNYEKLKQIQQVSYEWKKVDSIVNANLLQQGIKLNYDLNIAGPKTKEENKKLFDVLYKNRCYNQSLEDVLENTDVQIQINFPKRNVFMLAQMGPTFISTMLLITFLFMAFLIVLKSYSKEKQNSKRMKDFINNMTHELKTPLTNIAFANNMLLKKMDSRYPDFIKYSDVIKLESLKLTKQVDEILSILRNTAIDHNSSDIVLNNMLNELYQYNKQIINLKGGEIALNMINENVMVNANYSRLCRALNNIVDNAIKYSFDNIDITIDLKQTKESAIISISDHGIGIGNKDKELIFEKFYRVTSGDVHDVKGYGLGLYYAHSIITGIGGTVKVEDAPRKGLTFWINLPIVRYEK